MCSAFHLVTSGQLAGRECCKKSASGAGGLLHDLREPSTRTREGQLDIFPACPRSTLRTIHKQEENSSLRWMELRVVGDRASVLGSPTLKNRM